MLRTFHTKPFASDTQHPFTSYPITIPCSILGCATSNLASSSDHLSKRPKGNFVCVFYIILS